ncbi:MAG: hypothetical protein C4545_02875 [Anaerolineaceae bacterium]|jgi:hypothetical protein|nr:MAG: hypothetical protein C4545_02875 [Anaerolineaceae bacterium]
MAKNLVQAYKQTPRRKQIQKLGLYVLPVITLGTVFALYLVFSAQAAAAGLEIRSYLEKKEELQRTVANENTQLAWLISNTNMSKRAEKLGFSQISENNITYMVLPSYPGRSVKLTSPAPGSDSVSDIVLNSAYQQSLGDFLSEFLFSASNDEVQP